MPSSPLPPAAARAHGPSLPHPSAPRPAALNPPGLAWPPRPTPSRAGLKAGRGRGEKWASSLASPEGAETLGHRGSGSSSSPSHSLPPLSTCGGPRQEEVARTGPGDNCQLEALLGGGKRRGRERRGRALSAPPPNPPPRLSRLGRAVERSKERGTVAVDGEHA